MCRGLYLGLEWTPLLVSAPCALSQGPSLIPVEICVLRLILQGEAAPLGTLLTAP